MESIFLIMSIISRRLILHTLVRNLITLKMMMTQIQLLPDDNAETVPQNESPDPHQYPRGDRTKRMMKELRGE